MAKAAPRRRSGKSKTSQVRAARKPRVTQPPASLSDAADAKGMFLHTDDGWSRAYWNPADLHCVERELFAKGP
jgi:hypothetical protein